MNEKSTETAKYFRNPSGRCGTMLTLVWGLWTGLMSSGKEDSLSTPVVGLCSFISQTSSSPLGRLQG